MVEEKIIEFHLIVLKPSSTDYLSGANQLFCELCRILQSLLYVSVFRVINVSDNSEEEREFQKMLERDIKQNKRPTR